jgi:uncharacterized protein YbbC (DUF1343 family)
VETGVAVVDAFRSAGPTAFAWREPPYEYEHTLAPIDILYGSSELREGLARGSAAADICRGWADDIAPFLAMRKKHLLY